MEPLAELRGLLSEAWGRPVEDREALVEAVCGYLALLRPRAGEVLTVDAGQLQELLQARTMSAAAHLVCQLLQGMGMTGDDAEVEVTNERLTVRFPTLDNRSLTVFPDGAVLHNPPDTGGTYN